MTFHWNTYEQQNSLTYILHCKYLLSNYSHWLCMLHLPILFEYVYHMQQQYTLAPSMSVICHLHPWMQSIDEVSPSIDDIREWHFHPWMKFLHPWMTSTDYTFIHGWDLLWCVICQILLMCYKILGQFVSKIWGMTVSYMDEQISFMDQICWSMDWIVTYQILLTFYKVWGNFG